MPVMCLPPWTLARIRQLPIVTGQDRDRRGEATHQAQHHLGRHLRTLDEGRRKARWRRKDIISFRFPASPGWPAPPLFASGPFRVRKAESPTSPSTIPCPIIFFKHSLDEKTNRRA